MTALDLPGEHPVAWLSRSLPSFDQTQCIDKPGLSKANVRAAQPEGGQDAKNVESLLRVLSLTLELPVFLSHDDPFSVKRKSSAPHPGSFALYALASLHWKDVQATDECHISLKARL